ncbi:histidinol-phosphate transaminase [Jatrophihabitans lederbergiae]|uniref:Aromatic amino acid aminotransferase n=1 Tax=Jatrophihabitans lederbergiae TaxID=3075547 RepID=A0ABU2JBS5_9ACTN|nr:histidinol-phosphate transaminase [Jatrophihabitans sp. DSM 44399]MDT0262206.1 histidinol-phosphate transaminase [Jatrophihabitans sp. DSM 44399]
MTVRLRPTLAALPAYVPGKSVPGSIKLASNENSYGPLPHVLERIAAAAENVNRYPDTNSSELMDALAAKFGIGSDRLVVGCGSVSLCQQLVFATADEGDEVVFGWRSFEAYPIISAIAGATAVKVPLDGQTHDLRAMAAAVTDRTRLVFVCNPNNPTGTAVSGAALLRFLDEVPSDVLVVLDEAYHEFVTDPSVVDGTTLLERYPNVIVLRTFSKAYGLAGLRIGYGIAADPAITMAVRQTQVPFAVTQIAQVAALASLEPAAERQLAERVAEVTAERGRVTAELRNAGYQVPDSEANFVWLTNGPAEAGGIDATAFAAGCAERGLIVRAFADSGVRVTISNPAENDKFVSAAHELRA